MRCKHEGIAHENTHEASHCFAYFGRCIRSDSDAVMTNEVALAQMDASDISFMTWSLYRPAMTIVLIILCIISGCILGTVARDIHNYINKNEKE